MEQQEWEQQYLGEFATLAVPMVDRLAIEYHLLCEDFDRRVCSGRDALGDGRPENPYELSEVNMHARMVFDALRGQHPDIPEGRLRAAISRFGSRYTTDGLVRLAEAIRRQDVK